MPTSWPRAGGAAPAGKVEYLQAAETAHERELAELMGGRCGGPGQMDKARQEGVDRADDMCPEAAARRGRPQRRAGARDEPGPRRGA